MPIIGVIIGGLDFSNLSIKVGNSTIMYGSFIQNVVDFLIVAACIFFMIKVLSKFKKKEEVKKVNENPDFCTMRTKGTRLDFISIKSQKSVALVKILNEFALALVVLIAGFFVWRMRITRKYFIHQKYNSDDRRLIDKE